MRQSAYRGLVWRLRRQVERLEALGLEQYMLYVSDTKRFFWRNFMAGLARGLGGAVGFTILGAVVAVILSRLTVENIPLIGGFLAEIVEIVQRDLGKR
ncbi:MAG: DUF5665 domain-containing protein [Candidatus Fimadaptatus sp.]|jgi:ABC-type amino acid transport system permease subunit